VQLLQPAFHKASSLREINYHLIIALNYIIQMIFHANPVRPEGIMLQKVRYRIERLYYSRT
jgi:hypothetical protein